MSQNKGRIAAISLSKTKGVPKDNVNCALLIKNHGIEGDAHAGDWHRQVSLLDIAGINSLKDRLPQIAPGRFAENLTTEALDLKKASPGMRFKIGNEVILEVTQIGKECHSKCEIFHTIGDCIMPKEGVFTKVAQGGLIHIGDAIEEIKNV